MQELIKVLSYEGNNVTFRRYKDILFVNATEMAKVFGKRTNDYLSNQSTQDFIAAYIKNNPIAGNPVLVSNGGNTPGTWMHEDIALDFAQWLSVDFRLWCNARIKELLTIGMTATPETLESMLANPDLVIGLAMQLKELRTHNNVLEQQNGLLQQKVKVNEYKANYFDGVLQSESLLSTTEIAALLGMSAIALNKHLNGCGIQWKVNGRWVLTSKYNSFGYSKDKTVPIKWDNDGNVTETATQMYWTEKGKHFILATIKEEKRA